MHIQRPSLYIEEAFMRKEGPHLGQMRDGHMEKVLHDLCFKGFMPFFAARPSFGKVFSYIKWALLVYRKGILIYRKGLFYT